MDEKTLPQVGYHLFNISQFHQTSQYVVLLQDSVTYYNIYRVVLRFIIACIVSFGLTTKYITKLTHFEVKLKLLNSTVWIAMSKIECNTRTHCLPLPEQQMCCIKAGTFILLFLLLLTTASLTFSSVSIIFLETQRKLVIS